MCSVSDKDNSDYRDLTLLVHEGDALAHFALALQEA